CACLRSGATRAGGAGAGGAGVAAGAGVAGGTAATGPRGARTRGTGAAGTGGVGGAGAGDRADLIWSTPLPTGHSLSAPPSDESIEPSGPYPELVGCLMYLMTCARPDLAYPLCLLACYVAPGRHRKVHQDAAKRVLHYLCSTSDMGLVLGGRGLVALTGHANAFWASRPHQQVQLQTQQERVEEDSRPQQERVAEDSRLQQEVQLQPQQEVQLQPQQEM
ncbi:unnamed protein product, partial [Closterium sp. NIES-53]